MCRRPDGYAVTHFDKVTLGNSTSTRTDGHVTPLKPALIEGVAQKLPVLVRVQAPDAPPSKKTERKPHHLSLVIDRSGSMSGEPLHEAVRCARHMIDRMAATDTASLFAFDDCVNVLADAQPVGDGKALRLALERRVWGGGRRGPWDFATVNRRARIDAARFFVIPLPEGRGVSHWQHDRSWHIAKDRQR